VTGRITAGKPVRRARRNPNLYGGVTNRSLAGYYLEMHALRRIEHQFQFALGTLSHHESGALGNAFERLGDYGVFPRKQILKLKTACLAGIRGALGPASGLFEDYLNTTLRLPCLGDYDSVYGERGQRQIEPDASLATGICGYAR
jgi:hypothetical protein